MMERIFCRRSKQASETEALIKVLESKIEALKQENAKLTVTLGRSRLNERELKDGLTEAEAKLKKMLAAEQTKSRNEDIQKEYLRTQWISAIDGLRKAETLNRQIEQTHETLLKCIKTLQGAVSSGLPAEDAPLKAYYNESERLKNIDSANENTEEEILGENELKKLIRRLVEE